MTGAGLTASGKSLPRSLVVPDVGIVGVALVLSLWLVPEGTDVLEGDRVVELLGGGVTIVEGLAYLDRLTQPRVLFAALPLKLAAGDGCPVRAFAIEGVDPSALTG